MITEVTEEKTKTPVVKVPVIAEPQKLLPEPKTPTQVRQEFCHRITTNGR